MPEAEILNGNAEVTARLEALVGRLSDADLRRDLGGGWTVSVALAHLAFWDRRVAYVLERWTSGGAPHTELDDDVVNNALEELHKAVEPRAAARLAVVAARSANAAIAKVPDAIAAQLVAEDHAYLLRRSGHRGEHIEQIEAGLRG
ncbi:MAG TPA: maleylpyruvate isomerase N-terminal domain-containing protein [Dehalococcoidia bacterium]|nr:maleylpyruvate isomerase N-terminal domain-containing protein [Dehalococcoidia bacterium]